MPEFSVELPVLVVTYLQDSILHPEGVPIIIIQFVASDLDFPPLEVFAIKEAEPSALARSALLHCTTTSGAHRSDTQQAQNPQDGVPLPHGQGRMSIMKLPICHFQSLLISVFDIYDDVRLIVEHG